MLWIQHKGLYSQHFILFFAYESVQKVRVLRNTLLKRLGSYKHSSLLDLYISYEETEVLWIRPQAPNNISSEEVTVNDGDNVLVEADDCFNEKKGSHCYIKLDCFRAVVFT